MDYLGKRPLVYITKFPFSNSQDHLLSLVTFTINIDFKSWFLHPIDVEIMIHFLRMELNSFHTKSLCTC